MWLRRWLLRDSEFSRHYRLHELGLQTFCCDPRAPWQQGGVENASGRLRRLLPRRTDPSQLSLGRFIELLQMYNNTPRQRLDFLSPAEVFGRLLSRLQYDSTSLPAQE